MTPPPIRYPLPTLVLAIAVALLAWRGATWTRPLRAGLAERWARLVEGPPPPASAEPRVVAGPIVRRVLLLRDGVPATDRPGGRVVETIRLRQFADVYDVWPLRGPPTHDRIGNRRPIGWVDAADVLPWDTRLVLRVPEGKLALADSPEGTGRAAVEVGPVPLPVLAWSEGAIRVAVWGREHPWSKVERTGWVRSSDVPSEAWGVLLAQEEVRRLIEEPPSDDDSRSMTRLRAVLGRLGDPRPLSQADLDAARAALPGPVFAARGKGEELLKIYEHWSPDAAWSGFSFRAVPLTALP